MTACVVGKSQNFGFGVKGWLCACIGFIPNRRAAGLLFSIAGCSLIAGAARLEFAMAVLAAEFYPELAVFSRAWLYAAPVRADKKRDNGLVGLAYDDAARAAPLVASVL